MRSEMNLSDAELKFMHFIQEHQEHNVFSYREQLQKNAKEGKFFLRVSMEHILNFDEPLNQMLRR